jgi:hypothetical protein
VELLLFGSILSILVPLMIEMLISHSLKYCMSFINSHLQPFGLKIFHLVHFLLLGQNLNLASHFSEIARPAASSPALFILNRT